MKCIKCSGAVLMNGYCSNCGVKNDYYRKALNTSNYNYNIGLEKAQVRDLSGARQHLQLALKYNKLNTNARNLLGLIYFEMGEVVLALSEWVISVSFQPENNAATQYINSIQDNKAELDRVNQTVKKYNQTLNYAKQGSEDLALIQLKKVISLSPNFINGLLLLVLLYMQQGDKDKALKPLKRVLKIDAHNTMAFRYLQELNESPAIAVEPKRSREKETAIEKKSFKRDAAMPQAKVNTTPVGKYSDPGSSMRNILYIMVGMAIMFVVMWVLIVPSREDALKKQYQTNSSDNASTIASLRSKNETLESENAALLKEKDKLQAELNKYTDAGGSGNIYDQLLLGVQAFMDGDRIAAAKAISKIQEKDLESETAKNMYQKLYEQSAQEASLQLYKEGKALYDNGQFESAREKLQEAYDINSKNVDALYFLARSYHRLSNGEKAKELYDIVINEFPDSPRATEAIGKRNQIQ